MTDTDDLRVFQQNNTKESNNFKRSWPHLWLSRTDQTRE